MDQPPPRQEGTGLTPATACYPPRQLGSLHSRIALSLFFLLPMSSTSRWGDSGRLASTLLSLVRPQSTPAKDKSSAAEPETPESSSRKKRKRKHRKHRDSDRDRDQDHYLDTDPDQNQEQDNDQDDAMTTASPELPPLRHDHADDEGEADFGALPMFDSNATPASSQPADASASKKSRRDKKKDKHNLPSTKSQRRAQRHSSSLNGHEDGGDAPATPSSPSKKKRKNSDASDGKERKKRKSHAIDSIPEENGDNAELNGADADDIVRDVEAVAREAWAEHINKHAAQQQQYDTEMADAAPAEEAPADEPAEAPAGEVPSTPKRARSTRKKAKPTYFEAPVAEETLNTFAEMPSPSAMSPNPRRAKRAAPKKGPRRQRKLDRDLGYGADYAGKTYTQGKFSDDELARIAHAIEGFRVEHDMVQRDVNEVSPSACTHCTQIVLTTILADDSSPWWHQRRRSACPALDARLCRMPRSSPTKGHQHYPQEIPQLCRSRHLDYGAG